jgi:hypothetical protein
MKKYKSKIGLGILIYIAIILGSTSYFMFADGIWFGLIIIIAVAAFTLHLFLNTYYIVDEHHLIIRSGFMYCKTINIHTIRKIVETTNPLSSPAASLDRIAIHYNTYDMLMVSPKDKLDFMKHMTEINAGIEVVLKKDKKK